MGLLIVARRYAWRCGSNEFEVQSNVERLSGDNWFTQHGIALVLPLMLTLVNAPKLVETGIFGSRQERRAAFRTSSIAVDAWHKVSWRTAAGKKHTTGGESSDGLKKPLHYRRGHLRTAEKHYTGAFATKLTSTGWGQWIDGRWLGDPALGIKKSQFAPKFDPAGFKKFVDVQSGSN